MYQLIISKIEEVSRLVDLLRICRHCLGTESDIQTKFRECDFELRSSQQYSRHCDLIEQNPHLASHYLTTFGINRRSQLEALSYFTVAEGAMVPDVMHDILEGILPLELKNFICEAKLFTCGCDQQGC